MSRDRTLGETFYILFTTRAFASGIPTLLSGSPVVSAYENEGLTEITAGITLGEDHDGVAGLNLLTIVATTGNGYETGKDYSLVITTGTVGGVSVVGEVVGEFSLGLSAALTELNASQGDWATATGFSTHAATDIVSNGAITTLTGAVSNVTLVATLTTYTGNTLQTGDVTTAINDLANGTDGLTALKAVMDTSGVLVASLAAGSIDNTSVGTLDNTNFAFVDGNERIDVGQWLGSAVTANDAAVDSSIGDRTEGSRSLHNVIRDVGIQVESQRGAHTHQAIGNIFYVSPNDGATYASGARGGIGDPLLTIQDCHDNLVTDSNHDLIILLADGTAGPTTHTESSTTTISKRYCFIRGPGRDFIITRTGAGDTINITGEGVELSGVQIGTAATGAGRGVDTTGDFTYIHDCWLNATQGDGIRVDQAENCRIYNNTFQATGAGGSGHGMSVSGAGSSASNNNIMDNMFADVQGDAIRLSGGTIDNTVIMSNIMHGGSGNGININDGTATTVCNNTINDSGSNGILVAAGSTDAYLLNNQITGSVTSDINDSGTTTQNFNNVEWAKHSIATEARLVELDAANLPADIDLILEDSNELQLNQGNWLTATGFSTHAAADVWNVDISGVVTANFAGTVLNSAGSAGDPWSTLLPGA
jgi:hypothetical protein